MWTGILLYFLAITIYRRLTILNFVIVLITHTKKHGFFNVVSKYFFEEAFRIDVHACVAFRATWNLLLINKNGYKFGKPGETISSALGRNQLRHRELKCLTFLGWLLIYVLWIIDYKYWFKGGHCVNSIMEINTGYE